MMMKQTVPKAFKVRLLCALLVAGICSWGGLLFGWYFKNGWLSPCGAFFGVLGGFLLLRKTQKEGEQLAERERRQALSDSIVKKKSKKQENSDNGTSGTEKMKGTEKVLRLRDCLFAGTVLGAVLLCGIALRLLCEKLCRGNLFLAHGSFGLMTGYAQSLFATVILPVLFALVFSVVLVKRAVQRWQIKTVPSLLLQGIGFALFFPQLADVPSVFLLGVVLAYMQEATQTVFLPALCAFIARSFYLLYEYLQLIGFSGGEGMKYRDIFGMGLIFISMGALVLVLSHWVYKKRRPGVGLVVLAIGLAVFGAFVGVALVSA